MDGKGKAVLLDRRPDREEGREGGERCRWDEHLFWNSCCVERRKILTFDPPPPPPLLFFPPPPFLIIRSKNGIRGGGGALSPDPSLVQFDFSISFVKKIEIMDPNVET